MSDDIDNPSPTADRGAGARHATARNIAEKAMRAQADGDDEQADQLFADAARIDPEGAATALSDAASDPTDTATASDLGPQDDEEIAAMSRTVQPGSDAPSRANITGPGSGADNEG